jgi:hypothetical protein
MYETDRRSQDPGLIYVCPNTGISTWYRNPSDCPPYLSLLTVVSPRLDLVRGQDGGFYKIRQSRRKRRTPLSLYLDLSESWKVRGRHAVFSCMVLFSVTWLRRGGFRVADMWGSWFGM